jgi:hypothetical protein
MVRTEGNRIPEMVESRCLACDTHLDRVAAESVLVRRHVHMSQDNNIHFAETVAGRNRI